MIKRVLFLTNPGSARGSDDPSSVRRVLEQHGIASEHYELKPETDIGALIRSSADKAEAVIIGGGDGTLNSALPALMETGLPLGVIPLGTANDFARGIGVPLDPVEAAHLICRAHIEAIHVGEVNGRPFVNVANIGLGEQVRRETSGALKKIWGFMSYAMALFSAYRKQAPFVAEIVNGHQQASLQCIQITVGNGRFYGGGTCVATDADVRQPGLIVNIIKPAGFFRLLRIGPAIRRGELDGVPEVIRLDGDHFSITTTPAQGINADGEAVNHTPAECRQHLNAVRVFTNGGNSDAA